MKLCSHPGCTEWTDGATYCDEHRRDRQRENRSRYQRVRYGSSWPSIRRKHLAAHPLCNCTDPQCGVCQGQCTASAKEVDHIVPLAYFTEQFERAEAWRLAHSEENLNSLCKPCHSSKTIRIDIKR